MPWKSIYGLECFISLELSKWLLVPSQTQPWSAFHHCSWQSFMNIFNWCYSDVYGRKTIFNPFSPFFRKGKLFSGSQKVVYDWPIARLEHFRHNSGQVHWTSVCPCHGHDWGWSWVFNTELDISNKHAFQFINRCFHQFQWRRPSCWGALQHWCSRYHPRQKDWTSDDERRLNHSAFFVISSSLCLSFCHFAVLSFYLFIFGHLSSFKFILVQFQLSIFLSSTRLYWAVVLDGFRWP